MKKLKFQPKKTGVKQHRSNRSKLHRSKKFEVVFRSPGPSPYIIVGEDGKVSITNVVGNVKQKDYTTEIAKSSRQENKTAKTAKRDRVNQILAGAGFDPTIKYSRSEKKKFTRIVKKNLFVQPKPVNLTDEEIRIRFAEEKKRKAELLEKRPHKSEIEASVIDFLTKGREALAKMKSSPKKEENKKYRYVIQQQSKDNPNKDTDFLTEYLNASTKDEALEKAKQVFKEKYAEKEQFTGMRIESVDSKESIYYPKSTLLAAQSLT